MDALKTYLTFILVAFLSCQEPAFTTKEVTPGEADQLPERVDDYGTPVDGENPDDLDDPTLYPEDGTEDPEYDPKGPNGPNEPNGPENPGGVDPEEPPYQPSYIDFDQTFDTHRVSTTEINADLESATLSQDITLRRQYIENDIRHNQVARGPVNDQFEQGYQGFPITEDYVQSAEKKLDIIAVIDNSGSMQQEQVNLASKLNPLLSSVADTDWQIAVVTTDARDNCLRALLKKGESDIEQRFASAVTAGTNGSSVELGVYQSKRALAGECSSGSWVRDQSTIAVLIVSDEDNCSDGTECGNRTYKNKSYLLDYLSSVRVIGQTAKVYGLIWHPSQDRSECSTAGNKGNIYAEMISDTNGTWGSICDADYSSTLTSISTNISETLAARFSLSFIPDAGSLKVYIDNVLQTNGYSVTGNVVTFQTAPADGAAIRFDYLYNGKPLLTTFKLSKRPYLNDIAVTINGALISDADYSYNENNFEVTFNSAPPERAQIEFDYREYKVLKSDFSAPGDIVLNTLEVRVDGVLTSDYRYNPSAAAIQFNNAPAEGAAIRVKYTSRGNPVYSYPMTVNGMEPQDLELVDAATGNAVGFLYLLGRINVNPLEFAEGRALKALYYNDAREFTEVALPQAPIPGTIYATDGQVQCTDITVQAQTATVKDCGFEKDSMNFTLIYKYISKSFDEFEFNMEQNNFDPETAQWFVYINGQETSSYQRTGAVFKILESLEYNDKVTIKAKVLQPQQS